MAKLVSNLIHISHVLRMYIKALYDVVNVSKSALDLARDYGCNAL
jgi:predicted RNA-binding protein with RPS1 domain